MDELNEGDRVSWDGRGGRRTGTIGCIFFDMESVEVALIRCDPETIAKSVTGRRLVRVDLTKLTRIQPTP